MVVGAVQNGSNPAKQPCPRKEKTVVDTVCKKAVKKTTPERSKLLLLACVEDEVARPGQGALDVERQVWGEVFQSREHFVEMHFC